MKLLAMPPNPVNAKPAAPISGATKEMAEPNTVAVLPTAANNLLLAVE